jgi:hypothetical protein
MKISAWKEINTPDGLRPVIFFNPSLDFLAFVRNNGVLNIPIKIHGSFFYDGVYMVNINKVTNVNFCSSSSPMYSCVLGRDFTFIPPNLGTVEIAQIFKEPLEFEPSEDETVVVPPPAPQAEAPEPLAEVEEPSPSPSPLPSPTPSASPSPTKNPMRLWYIIVIFIIIILILLACFLQFLL